MTKLHSLGCIAVLSLLLVTDIMAFGFGTNMFSSVSSVIPSGVTVSSILDAPTNLLRDIGANVSSILDAPKNLLRDIIPGAKQEKKVCYPRLGCFSLAEPWYSILRPLPAPWSPTKISPKLSLFTRSTTKPYNISLDDQEWSLGDSDFDKSRPATVFVTHGFSSNGNADWLLRLVKAYLKNKDANIFILDWKNGATLTNYLQVASNTRIVGAQLARFLRHLINLGLGTDKVHLIGHSLGSHIMSYCAKNVSEISKVKRITGLDPAQPAFECTPETVRLAPTDAEEVDVIHTDAKPFLPFFGFGMLSPVGTVDFYVNGGSVQPGCLQLSVPNITNVLDLVKYPVEAVADFIGCSHGRSYEIFIAALNDLTCTFCGRKMMAAETFLKISTLGTLKLADPLVKELTDCNKDTCNFIGLDTFKLPARGSFAVITSGDSPYCELSGDESFKLKNRLTTGLRNLVSGVTGTITNVGRSLRFI